MKTAIIAVIAAAGVAAGYFVSLALWNVCDFVDARMGAVR